LQASIAAAAKKNNFGVDEVITSRNSARTVETMPQVSANHVAVGRLSTQASISDGNPRCPMQKIPCLLGSIYGRRGVLCLPAVGDVEDNESAAKVTLHVLCRGNVAAFVTAGCADAVSVELLLTKRAAKAAVARAPLRRFGDAGGSGDGGGDCGSSLAAEDAIDLSEPHVGVEDALVPHVDAEDELLAVVADLANTLE
jgi:hypothetical protein